MRKSKSSRGAYENRPQGLIGQLWDSFWSAPDEACPKCGGTVCEYYDPFFFSPIRTLNGRRRIKCIKCRFIWRPSRKRRSFLEQFKIRM